MKTDKHYTYIVRCSDGTLYTGYTNDLDKRVRDHNSGKGAKYTKTRIPVNLVYYEVYENKTDAMSREWHIKQDLSKTDKELLIKNASNSLTDSDAETTMNLNKNISVEWRNKSMADDKKIEATKTEEIKAAPVEKKTRGRKPAAKKVVAKKPSAKKPGRKPAKKLGKIIIEIDGQQIDIKALEKKAAKLGGDVYVVTNEKKIFDKDGKSVELF